MRKCVVDKLQALAQANVLDFDRLSVAWTRVHQHSTYQLVEERRWYPTQCMEGLDDLLLGGITRQ
jgi:hypothetical protein